MTNRSGCMPTFIFGGLAMLALLVLLSSVVQRTGAQYTSTVERVLQPAASVQLEAQQLAAQTERARIDAERTAQRDFYIFVGALTFAGMIVLLLFAWLFTRRPQVVTLQLPEGTPPHLIEAQWRLIDTEMETRGFEMERRI